MRLQVGGHCLQPSPNCLKIEVLIFRSLEPHRQQLDHEKNNYCFLLNFPGIHITHKEAWG